MSTVTGTGTPSAQTRKVMAVAPISASTTQTSTGIPTTGFRWMDVALLVGVMTATGTIDCKLQESQTLGGTYADITSAAFSQKLAASDGSKVYTGQIDLQKRLPFIRVVCANATAASVVAVVCTMSQGDRTERVQGAQLGSSPAASPLAGDGVATGAEFTV